MFNCTTTEGPQNHFWDTNTWNKLLQLVVYKGGFIQQLKVELHAGTSPNTTWYLESQQWVTAAWTTRGSTPISLWKSSPGNSESQWHDGASSAPRASTHRVKHLSLSPELFLEAKVERYTSPGAFGYEAARRGSRPDQTPDGGNSFLHSPWTSTICERWKETSIIWDAHGSSHLYVFQ